MMIMLFTVLSRERGVFIGSTNRIDSKESPRRRRCRRRPSDVTAAKYSFCACVHACVCTYIYIHIIQCLPSRHPQYSLLLPHPSLFSFSSSVSPPSCLVSGTFYLLRVSSPTRAPRFLASPYRCSSPDVTFQTPIMKSLPLSPRYERTGWHGPPPFGGRFRKDRDNLLPWQQVFGQIGANPSGTVGAAPCPACAPRRSERARPSWRVRGCYAHCISACAQAAVP